jgi:hypothetical protein
MFKLGLISVLLVFFTSCVQKTQNGAFNKDYNNYIKSDFNKTRTKNYVKDSIKEILNKNNNLELENPKRLSSILDNLGLIDGNNYLLDDEAKDIFIKSVKESYKLNINNFDKLNQYIQDTSNYFIYIKKNRFLKNRIKVVGLRNQSIYKKDLKNIPFSIDGRMSVSEVLEQLKNVSGFNVIAKNLPSTKKKKTDVKANEKLFGNNSLDGLFNNTYISFSGNNIMELLNYISASFNLYVDVDYKNKIIIFQKLKSKVFTISLNNIQYSGSLDIEKTVKNDVGSDSSKKSISTKIELDLLDSLKVGLEDMLEKSKIDQSLLFFNKAVGTVFVQADKKTMKNISIIIDNFNTIFDKQIDFELEIYEFAVRKGFDVGISLGAKIDTKTSTGEFKSNQITNSIFNIIEKAGTSSITKSIPSANLNNQFVRLLTQSRHGYILKNSIPYYMDFTTSQNYVKTIETKNETTNNVTSTKVTPIIETTSEGTIISVLAKVNGNKIEFNIQPKVVNVDASNVQNFGKDEEQQSITLPKVSLNTFTSNIILKSDERRIIGYLTEYEDTNNYNGIVPIENFIIGGEQSRKYFRKETVFVVSAKIRN